MINSPQFITALGAYYRTLNKGWDPSWNRNQRRQALIDAAIEAGLSSNGLLKETEIKQRNFEKGISLRQQGEFSKASKYLGKALIRDPSDANIIKLLADSAYRYWKETKDKETLFALAQLAGLILKLNPDDLQGVAIRTLAMEQRNQDSKSNIITLFIAMLIVMGGGLWAWNQYMQSGQSLFDAPSVKAEEPESNLLDGFSIPKSPTIGLPPKLELLESPSGILMIDQSSILRIQTENDTFSYLLKAEIHNQSQLELIEMQGSISLYGTDGQLIASRDNLSLLPQHKGPMRPKDIIGFRERFQISDSKGIAPTKAIIRVTKTQSYPAPNNYPKQTPIKLDWNVPPNTNQNIVATLRSAKRQPNLNWNTHQIVINNQGAKTIRTLQLELSYFNESNNRIGIETEYAVFVSGASLPPGQSRLVNFNLSSAETPNKIRLKVISIN